MTIEELATATGDRIRAQSPFNRVALSSGTADRARLHCVLARYPGRRVSR